MRSLWSLFFFIGLLFSQWGPDVRLTVNDSCSFTHYNRAIAVDSSGVLHVVWYDERNSDGVGNDEIYYKRSTDGGTTWEPDRRLTYDENWSRYPAVAASNSNVYVVWSDSRGPSWWEIYYKHSTDGGVTWGSDTRLSNTNMLAMYAAISISGSNVHVVWHDLRDGNYEEEIYYKRSTDEGMTWSLDYRLTDHANSSMFPTVAASGDNVYVAWEDWRDNIGALYYKRSTNNGQNWSQDKLLTDFLYSAKEPGIAALGSNVHVVFRASPSGIYYKRSTNDGKTWGPDTSLSTDYPGWFPSISVSGYGVHVVWDFDNYLNKKLYYKCSLDQGATWSQDTCLTSTSATGYSMMTSVAIFDPMVHVVWFDKRSGNDEVYYKRNLTGNGDYIPPIRPYIPKVIKTGADVNLAWNKVTTDTLGNSETIDHYVIYRSTDPAFIPSPSDSVGGTTDTFYTDVGVLSSSLDYYYLVKAVDAAKNRSRKSNMGYKFNKFFNENASATDKNWVSLPWHNGYSAVSDLTTDLSASGSPLEKITNLRDDQNCESWLWDPDFFEWGGANFVIQPGRGYEMVTIKDTTLVLVGANNPDGLINLNENPGATDKNWVSIPYNAVYVTVNDITTEYSPSGNPLEKITNLRDDQNCESWLWDPDFFEWGGANFAIEPGRAYEFVTIKDTFWNPTEYSNEARQMGPPIISRPSVGGIKGGVRKLDLEIQLGRDTESKRAPVWITPLDSKHSVKQHNFEVMKLRSSELPNFSTSSYRESGVSHIVRCHLSIKDFENLVFTAYRPDKPYDALTEDMIGSCVMKKDDRAAVWFDVANFKIPWENKKEEVIFIIEAIKQGRGYFAVVNFLLDNSVDIQELKDVSLMPISRDEIDDKNVIGYSLYQGDKRLNEKVIDKESSRPLAVARDLQQARLSRKIEGNNNYEFNLRANLVSREVVLRPVIKGGYETVYSSGPQGEENAGRSMPCALRLQIYPSVFREKIEIRWTNYDLRSTMIRIYDVTGRLVKTFSDILCNLNSSVQSVSWDGVDDSGNPLSPGIYFLMLKTGDNVLVRKICKLK